MKLKRFSAFAWGVLGYNLLVILWGGYVRATGSGAGCANHWPACNGPIVPHTPIWEILIDSGHRLTSGLAGLLVIALVIWAFKLYPGKHLVRTGAIWSLIFIMVEGLLGMALVRFEAVAQTIAWFRAVMVGGHLINLFILLTWLTLTAWWASGGSALRRMGGHGWLLGVGLLAITMLGATGAVAALGDTLFPDIPWYAGLRQNFSPLVNFLRWLRIIHPFLALLTGLHIFFLGSFFRQTRFDSQTRRLANSLLTLFIIQSGVGLINLLLLAPVWVQLIHLLLANLVWITLVLLTATVLSRPVTAAEAVHPAGLVGESV